MEMEIYSASVGFVHKQLTYRKPIWDTSSVKKSKRCLSDEQETVWTENIRVTSETDLLSVY